jgi:hypothetical protein
MTRQIVEIPLVNIILTFGLVWGVATLLWGLGGSFVLGSTNFYAGLVGIIFGYLIVLPLAIVAFWRPKISAACLLISFLVLECSVFTAAGIRSVLVGTLVMGLPTAALAWGYTYVARVRQKTIA